MTLISAPLAAWYYSLPVGTVHYWANADNWAKHGTRRERTYDMTDVQASYLRRRVPPEMLDSLTCGQARFISVAHCARRTP